MTIAERPSTTGSEERLEFELDPELQAELDKHRGEWVALTRSQLVAFGPDLGMVLAAARQAGFEHPIVYRIPEDADVAYFF